MNEKTILQKENISDKELQSLLQMRAEKKTAFLLIDIREYSEIEQGYIKGADAFYPTSSFMNDMPKLKEEVKDTHIVFYCRSGGRSGQVMGFLKNEGWSNMSHLSKGIIDYTGDMVR